MRHERHGQQSGDHRDDRAAFQDDEHHGLLPPEQACGPEQQHQRHHQEHNGGGCLRIIYLGEALDHAEAQAGDGGAHDRAEPADHHDRKHDDDEVGPHRRVDMLDRRRQHTGECGEPDARAIGQRQKQRNIDPERPRDVGPFGRSPEVGADPRLLDDQPGCEADHDRHADHEGAVDRKNHEAEIPDPAQLGRRGKRMAGRTEGDAKTTLDHQHQAERQQQAVNRIEAIDAAQKQPLEQHAEQAHHNRGHQQRGPVTETRNGVRG